MTDIRQTPEPGCILLRYCGDTIRFELTLDRPNAGKAYLRTNIGQAETARREIIDHVRINRPQRGRDWYDIRMVPDGSRRFHLTLPLEDVGHFQAKAYFMPALESQPVWPPGYNVEINVEPADTCCANIVYNAFVRQFGPNKAGTFAKDDPTTNCVEMLDDREFVVIPPSGRFRDLIAELDFIVFRLGCRWIQLLPIFPTPTTYGRMGRFGSPYAALGFTAIDPALAEFDLKATPLEQFIELADAIHRRRAKLMIDIAINHTGWAAGIHETHPQWLVRNPEGEIENPGAWGVRWEDLTKLDYTNKDLWLYMAEVFLTWCRRGVDGFRCDAGYMIPLPAWEYIIAEVRRQFPDTVFLLEGLGGKISTTRSLMGKANFNWAYSELFQNYDRGQIEHYLPEAMRISQADGLAVHYAETHDNPRLASKSIAYAKMRTALCALFSNQGGFGFANGVEWFADEKINVHEASSLNWGSTVNQVEEISRLTRILSNHPAFHDQTGLSMIQNRPGNYLVLLRHHYPTGKKLLILVNLDDQNPGTAFWPRSAGGSMEGTFRDLLTGRTIIPEVAQTDYKVPLSAAQVICLTPDAEDLDLMSTSTSPLSRSDNQRARAKALEVFCHANGTIDIGDFDPGAAAAQLLTSPADFCRQMHDSGKEPRIVRWRWPEDLRREVMLPPNHFLLVAATDHFVAKLILKNRVIRYERSLEGNAGYHFVLLSPPATPLKSTRLTLELTVFEKNATRRGRAFIKSLPMGDNAVYQLRFSRRDLASTARTYLNTNRLGAMIHTPIRWGELNSRYDALLAANQNSEFPTDRLIMFTRCRGWIVHQDYSEEICADRLVGFETDIEGGGHWRFQIPTGRGQHVVITISLDMDPFENITHLRIHRHSAANRQGRLADSRPIRLILRPDIENRDFHGVTKAYMGAEHHFPRSTTGFENRFEFTPDADRRLNIGISSGDFIVEPEWQYMIFRPVEADRGLDPQSDLFSPGYFAVSMTGDDRVTMTAQVRCAGCGVSPTAAKGKSASLRVRPDTPASHLERSMNAYLVRRGDMKSVIAGYPWFLDWGRDALIFVRGLIAAGRTADARDVLVQFGQFEEAGTLPNMIHGQDARNRDTSDAPLWFITCCGELIRAEGKRDFLDASCGSRCIRDILLSIANAYANGTPNGVRMDHATGLIFSPSHFTWMDTNYPAGTPRQGYPIEIQALWFAALSFLSEEAVLKSPAVWADLAKKTAESIRRLFFLSEKGFLSDCLHGGTTTPAADARPDDALRPNQLLAVTLGAVRDPAVSGSILDACSTLLVPGAIRSLADQPVTYPVDILIDDRRLVDPLRPYQGRYAGDEDTKRKPAYHNGTAWTWMFPSFCEAWAITYGKAARDTALSWLSSSFDLINSGCVGHVPEILDGDYPHAQRGCDAQAWGESELLRVWRFLKKE